MSKLKLSSNASGSGNVTLQSPNTNSDFTVTVPTGTGALPLMRLETAQTATGTSVDFTGIPSWVKRITVMFSQVSLSGSSQLLVQLGGVSIQTTGYDSNCAAIGTASNTNVTNGFLVTTGGASTGIYSGLYTICLVGGNEFSGAGNIGRVEGTLMLLSGGHCVLSDTLDRIRITTVNGTDTFDAGTINILYEG